MKKNPAKINIIALTQGANIDIFLRLKGHLASAGMAVEKAGALVSMASHFQRSKAVKELGGDVTFLKEWEVVQRACQNGYDAQDLKKREEALCPAAAWNAIIGDRRLIYGRYAKFIQDYKVRFTDDELWSIAYQFMLDFEKMLDEIKPDVVVGFTPVTFGELLALEICAGKNIPTLQLHSSRIRNYFALHDVVSGTSRHFITLMEKNKFSKETRAIAQQTYEDARGKGLIYEGANKSIAKGRKIRPAVILHAFLGAVKHEALKQINSVRRNDHHDPGFVIPWALTHLFQPFREFYVRAYLKRSCRHLVLADLPGLGAYCFFPMQSEPEVSLQVLGRPYHKNQVELLRNLAASLPAGMKLVIKEHPRSMGLRPLSWYKDLFDIPNLYFVDVYESSMPMVTHAEFVAVISGTIGLEAIMMGKPVLILGHPKYEDVPGKMTEKCYNLYDLPAAIRNLLEKYKFDESEILKFLSALVDGSVDIDLYSNLLKKPGRQSFQDGKVSYEEDLDKLAKYTIKRIEEAQAAKASNVKYLEGRHAG